MNHFQLVEIVTKDKLIHQGIYFEPSQKIKRAILWVHGLSSTFYGHIPLLDEFSRQCQQSGIGFASFNNRGHDPLASVRKIDKRKAKGYSHVSGGAGQEDFKKSVFDIEAGIKCLVSKGFDEILLVGHSTGANKVSYYAAVKRDPHVVGVILASPVSDRLDIALDKEKLQQDLKHMEQLVAEGKGDELQLGYHFFPITPQRFVSLFKPNSLEDQFDYGDEKPVLKYFKRIKKPLLVLIGSADEYLDRPAEKVLTVFNQLQRSNKYDGKILPGVLHSYNESEKEVVKTIISWMIEI
jgi:pimeloyl-ACP methyl ester carboxylesterase